MTPDGGGDMSITKHTRGLGAPVAWQHRENNYTLHEVV